jgi:hypothetical protein
MGQTGIGLIYFKGYGLGILCGRIFVILLKTPTPKPKS